MRNILTLLFMALLSLTAFTQKVENTYYDYAKTQLYESYQVNDAGERHGWYKGYDQNGLVKVEANYKNGALDGTRTEYATGSGKRILAKTETYKDNVLNGPAKYYTGTLVTQQGEYLNGEKNGEWLDAYMYTNYDLTDEEKKGCDFVKRTITYENGKVVDPKIESGELIETFYPSGKTRAKIPYSNNKKHGVAQYFFPTGGIEMEEGFDQGKLTYTLTNYPNGKLREYNGLKDGVETYEQYDEYGKPTRNMENYKANKEKYAKAKVYLEVADKNMIDGDYKSAQENYYQASLLGYGNDQVLLLQKVSKATEKWGMNYQLFDVLGEFRGWQDNIAKMTKNGYKNVELFSNLIDSTITAILDAYILKNPKSVKETIDQPQYMQIIGDKIYNATTVKVDEELKRREQLAQLDKDVTAAKTKYNELYGPPNYLRSSLLYEKINLVISELQATYDSQTAFTDKVSAGERLLAVYNKVNTYTDEQVKEYKKSLKKVDDIAQIRSVLGI